MTYYCSECMVGWAPYQALGGSCPRCKSGTTRRQEGVTEDADGLFRAIKALEKEDRERAELLERFEAFYAEWDASRSGEEWRALTPDVA